MFDMEHRFQRLHNFVNENRRIQTALIAASQAMLKESNTLMAASLSVIQRAEARRTASGSNFLSRVVADGDIVAEVLPTLIQLHEIRRRFMHNHDRGALINDVLDAVTKATKTDLGNIQLFDSRRGMLEIAAQRGFGSEFLDFFGEVQGAGAACGAAMAARQRVIVEDVVTHPIFVGQPAQDVLLRAGVHAVQSTPLITESGELVGMMSTHFRSRHRVPAYRLRLLDITSRQFAELLHTAPE